MRTVGWILIAMAGVVVVLGTWMTISYLDTYDYNGLGELISQGWWVLASAALPGLTGWLFLLRNPKWPANQG